MEQGGEIFVYGTNASGVKEWLVPAWDTLSEEDKDELAALGAAMNAETEKAKRCFSGAWECAITPHEDEWIDFHLRGNGEGGVEAKGRQWRPYGPRGREIDAIDANWWTCSEEFLCEYRREILAEWEKDFGKNA